MRKLLFLLFLPVQLIFAQEKDVIILPPNLVTQGIPEIPISIKDQVHRYTESRGAGFADWHPIDRSMVISTRFANVPQLHLVKMPLGARKQITFYDEGITGATYEPKNGNYFLFTKDVNML